MTMSVRRGCRRDVATQRVTIGNFYGLDGLESISQTTLKNESVQDLSTSLQKSQRLIAIKLPKSQRVIPQGNEDLESVIASSTDIPLIEGRCDEIDIPLGRRHAETNIPNSNVTDLETPAANDAQICRICLDSGSREALIQPCTCRGTVARVHLKCLERWIRESNHSRCEICQERYRFIRRSNYTTFQSICKYLRHSGHHWYFYKSLLILIASLIGEFSIAWLFMNASFDMTFLRQDYIIPHPLINSVIWILCMTFLDHILISIVTTEMLRQFYLWRFWCRRFLRVLIIDPPPN
ncbi:uncharacterized protein LOC109604342 isoform X1 [Aethina tumida]|uniref:uncharacterized protein LOC109604342 isoform X1 n=1 Tax=Aethina tumida TaxID=116153 RepID=UPI00214793F6|nr:uncharacterized protein LOC109604342 isoform X1 [Aethina tumida]